jgi:hypothetical protein
VAAGADAIDLSYSRQLSLSSKITEVSPRTRSDSVRFLSIRSRANTPISDKHRDNLRLVPANQQAVQGIVEYKLNLPIELSSFHICGCESRMDLIRALITGTYLMFCSMHNSYSLY